MKEQIDHTERYQENIISGQIWEGDRLYDHVYDEEVDVVGVYVGKVYLRYPHQEEDPDAPEGSHIESCPYDWPLDGHRFTKIE